MRISPIPATTADAKVAPLYAAVKSALGVVPNLMQIVGNSPAALEGYLSLNGALGKGVLPAAVRERIALAVAESNGCDYCLAAHSLLGKGAGLSPEEIQRARLGGASEPVAAGAVALARAIVANRGKVSDLDLAAARRSGLSEAAIIEVAVHVALNVLTNYVNNLAQTTVDFPAAAPLAKAAA